MKFLRGRKSLADHKRAVNAALRFYGVPLQNVVAEKRIRKPSGRKLERDVLREVLEALRADPRVAMVERRQSGVFQEGNRVIRVGHRGLADITGMLVGGRSFAIEVKAPGRKPDARQAEYLRAFRANGGIAGFATSAAEALALLP